MVESSLGCMQIGLILSQLEQHAQSQKDKVKAEAAQQVADELLALQSIYGTESLTLLQTSPRRDKEEGGDDDGIEASTSSSSYRWEPHEPLRLRIVVPLDADDETSHRDEDGSSTTPSMHINLSATLPPYYPQSTSAPQLQLLNRYVGSHGVDHTLFGQVLRLFHHHHHHLGHEDKSNGSVVGERKIVFVPGEVILFDGIEKVREIVKAWHEKRDRESESQGKLHRPTPAASTDTTSREREKKIEDARNRPHRPEEERTAHPSNETVAIQHMPIITSSQTFKERKSVFVGHAAILEDASQVPLIISSILQDKKIARATHPAIYAWVCRSKGGGSGSSAALQRDHDDDGESAAGGRLAHLLDLLHLENVIIIVTRWYGGVQLGADRFKLINRAARDALESAKLIPQPHVK